MENRADDPRAPVDARVNSPGREGLTGTAPADLYAPALDRGQITIAPDFAPPAAQPAWRSDFPIDWPQDQYVERRDFMKFMVLISSAFATGQLWIAVQNWRRKRSGQLPVRRIASVADVAVGAALVFAYPEAYDQRVLVRISESEFVAFSQKCTHLSCAVLARPSEQIFYCPCHEGRFDLRTGAPLSGPPRRPLPRVTLEIRSGAIYATGVQEPTT
jgi:nitrite reductase/ring-hydroxylating ferredoxin subunit